MDKTQSLLPIRKTKLLKNKPNKPNSNGFNRKRSEHKKRPFRHEGREPTEQSSWVKRGQVWRTPKTFTKTDTKKPEYNDNNKEQPRPDQKSMPGGFEHFSEIPAHRLGKSLRNDLYKLANDLPEDENLNLRHRIKYAATTVTSSLATGFGYGTYRGALNAALECRAALYGLQDHIEQLAHQQLVKPEEHLDLKRDIDTTISAVNQFIGQLKKDQG